MLKRVLRWGDRAVASLHRSTHLGPWRALGSAPSSEGRDFGVLLQPSPYPDAVRPSESVSAFVRRFEGQLEPGARAEEHQVVLCGRVAAKREASRKLVFLDLEGDGGASVQVLADRKWWGRGGVAVQGAGVGQGARKEDLGSGDLGLEGGEPGVGGFEEVLGVVRRGDWVAVEGFAGRSGRGELSVIPRGITLLAPCLRNLPERGSLEDAETRARQRYLDMVVNGEEVRGVFRKRALVLQGLRRALDARGFLEVETPILSHSAGGALATPFVTRAKALGSELQLRIAPELFLKQCVIGGLERVYEVGKVFRNEGIDLTHSPEFTSCEFYAAHADLPLLMQWTQDILREVVELVKERGGEGGEEEDGEGSLEVGGVDFGREFAVIDIREGLEEAMGTSVPDPEDAEGLLALLDAFHIPHPTPATPARLWDALIAHFLEPQCHHPTFLTGHPAVLSPLARSSTKDPRYCERFELFVAGKELCNAYAELNDPEEQLRRFQAQAAAKDSAGRTDPEAHAADMAFVEALKHGLPPTGGWGLGVDRLVMLLTQRKNIRDVTLFPVLKKSAEQEKRGVFDS